MRATNQRITLRYVTADLHQAAHQAKRLQIWPCPAVAKNSVKIPGILDPDRDHDQRQKPNCLL